MRQRYRAKVEVIRNIPPLERVDTGHLIHDALGLDRHIRIALYQGGIQRNRGLNLLVEAGQYLPEGCAIVIMGAGESRALLEEQSRTLRVTDRVRFLPPVPHGELLRWTASAHVGLLLLPTDYSLSIKYCLPNKLFEYLMAGVPVLSSRLQASADLILRYDVGRICEDLTPKGAAVAIADTLSAEDSLAEWKANALAASSTELNWESEGSKAVALYSLLIGPPHDGPSQPND